MHWFIGLGLIGALGAGWNLLPAKQASKRIIGQTAWVEVAESGLGFLGRVDTGAASTSVHAESIRIDGEMVDFVMANRSGNRVRMRAPLIRTSMVRNAVGEEERVYVELTIRHYGLEKQVQASLNDRSSLNYALLLGRNWLQDDFVVDVTRDAVPPAQPWPATDDSRGVASR